MYKVLVVDDEPYMLEGWRSMVDWNAHGFDLYGTAADGEEALAAVRDCPPDLLITDIRMPALDGLGLIRAVKEELGVPASFVIVSGYSQFEYAKRAIDYGVNHYLLKPLLVEEVYAVLSELRAALERDRRAAEAERGARTAAAAAALAAAVRRGDRAAMREAAQLLGADEAAVCRLIVAELPRELPPGAAGADARENAGAAAAAARPASPAARAEAVAAECLPPGVRASLFGEAPHRLALLAYGAPTAARDIDASVPLLADRLAAALPDAAVGVSGGARELAALPDLFRQALLACGRPGRAGYYRDAARPEAWRLETATDRAEALLRAVDEGDEAAIRAAVDRLSGLLAGPAEPGEPAEPGGWAALCLSRIQSGLLRRYAETGADTQAPPVWLREVRERPLEAAHWHGERARRMYAAAAAELAALRGERGDGAVQRALAHIRGHYREALQLRRLAERFGLHPAYLGQRIKQATGMSCSDYVHFLRIEEAKTLLRRTDRKMTDIARQLGYRDSEYFAVKFKAFTNQSPSAYKHDCKGDRHAEPE